MAMTRLHASHKVMKIVLIKYLTYLLGFDLQGLDAELPNASALEDANALALAIVPEGKLSFQQQLSIGVVFSSCLLYAY